MAIALVQKKSADVGSTTSTTLTFASTTTAGNLIVVCARIGGTSTAAITDNKSGGSNNYGAGPGLTGSDIGLAHASFGTCYIFSAANAGAASIITCTLTGGAATIRWAIAEYSGIATAAPLDKTSSLYTATHAPTSWNSGDTATTTQADELLIGCAAGNTSSMTWSAGTSQSYTLREVQPAAAGTRFGYEDAVVSATAAYQADFSWTGLDSDLIALIATYKAATAVVVLPPHLAAARQSVKRSAYF